MNMLHNEIDRKTAYKNLLDNVTPPPRTFVGVNKKLNLPTFLAMDNRTNENNTPIRAYTKAELAQLYNPHLSYITSLQQLRRWLQHNPALMDELRAAGYRSTRHSFTPREVAIIFRYLGEP
jgi:hypothetical protein